MSREKAAPEKTADERDQDERQARWFAACELVEARLDDREAEELNRAARAAAYRVAIDRKGEWASRPQWPDVACFVRDAKTGAFRDAGGDDLAAGERLHEVSGSRLTASLQREIAYHKRRLIGSHHAGLLGEASADVSAEPSQDVLTRAYRECGLRSESTVIGAFLERLSRTRRVLEDRPFRPLVALAVAAIAQAARAGV